MKVLFICHANLNRSPRAAEVFRKITDQKGLSVEVQSAGTSVNHDHLDPPNLREVWGVENVTQLTSDMLRDADVVVALDDWVRQEIETGYRYPSEKITTLGIPDIYSLRRGNLDVLYGILNQKLEPLAEELLHSHRTQPGKEVF